MKIKLTLENGLQTLYIAEERGETFLTLTGNASPSQRKEVEQMKGKNLGALTTLKLLYQTFNLTK